MAEPTTVEEWVDRLNEMAEEMDTKTITSAFNGNTSAKGMMQTWAAEMQAASLFVAGYTGAASASEEALVEVANKVIDTVQAILLALGIIWLLKRLKRQRKGAVLEIVVTERQFRKDLGDRTEPIPSRPDSDKEDQVAFIAMRVAWTIHYLLTVMQALKIQAEGKGDGELVWKAHLDDKTCSVCRYMHNKKSINGDFLPVILKQFPSYRAFAPWMGFPHAHPRCRCVAVPA